MKLTPKKSFYAMLGLVGLMFVLIITAVVLGNAWLQKQSKQLEAIKLESRLIDEQQTAVVRANKDIQKYAELEKIANSIVPQDKDQARTVREIVKLADENGVPVASITFPASTLGTTQAVKPTGTAATGSSTPAATTPVTASPITQAVPVSGLSGVYQMLVTVQSDTNKTVTYESLINFLAAMEKNRRTAQVDNISIQPSPKNPSQLTFNLGVNVFIKP